jgi:hypothetical protein
LAVSIFIFVFFSSILDIDYKITLLKSNWHLLHEFTSTVNEWKHIPSKEKIIEYIYVIKFISIRARDRVMVFSHRPVASHWYICFFFFYIGHWLQNHFTQIQLTFTSWITDQFSTCFLFSSVITFNADYVIWMF